MMRKSLQQIEDKIVWLDPDNLYQSIYAIRSILIEILEKIDEALPIEKEPD